ncbi:hypothetical protein ABG067_007180 [Albugo candida]
MTGATAFSEELGHRLETNSVDMLGTAKKVTITIDDTLTLDGAGTPELVEERCGLLRAKLSGGVSVIKVGGASELEVNEKKDRVVDALDATLAAVAEGIVHGGGYALLWSSKSVPGLYDKCENLDQKGGVQIIQRACRAPVTLITKNAGEEGAAVVGKLCTGKEASFEFNAQTSEYVDMVEAGIIDQSTVLRKGLLDASSVASLMMTVEVLIVDLPSDASDAPPIGGRNGWHG